jgi:hypothetical protein
MLQIVTHGVPVVNGAVSGYIKFFEVESPFPHFAVSKLRKSRRQLLIRKVESLEGAEAAVDKIIDEYFDALLTKE